MLSPSPEPCKRAVSGGSRRLHVAVANDKSNRVQYPVLMCRMIVAPLGISGHLLIDPFLRMAQGLNALSELNQALGNYTQAMAGGL